MFWGLEDPERLLRERSELESLCGEVLWISRFQWGMTKEVMLKVDVDLIVEGTTYDIELVYPILFPDAPAYVRPRTSAARWSSHQYGAGGVLCLEWGPDNWHAGVTGAELLRSTFKLLSGESDRGISSAAVPSRHDITFGQEIRSSRQRLVITTSVHDFLQSAAIPSLYNIKAQYVIHKSTGVLFVEEFIGDNDERYRSEDLPEGIADFIPLCNLPKVGWCFKSNEANTKANLSSVDDVLGEIHSAGFEEFVFPSSDGDSRPTGEFLILLINSDHVIRAITVNVNENTVIDCSIIESVDRTDLRSPPVRHVISEKKVGIVGVGSVGSKVAISLARSGVRHFILVDDDVMLQGNVTRHELGWESIGVNKVHAVKEALSLIAQGIDVRAINLRVSGQESAQFASTVLNELSNCDVLVEATANSEVFVQLAAVAKRRSIPLVWGEVFSGGIGALLLRSRPSLDPYPLNMRAGVHNYLQTQPPAPYARATNYDVHAEHGRPLIAFDAEVMQFTASLTRFVIDILLCNSPSEFPYSAYLIGFKKEWIFEGPFDTRPICVEKISDEVGSSDIDKADVHQSAVDVLVKLVNEQSNDNTTTST